MVRMIALAVRTPSAMAGLASIGLSFLAWTTSLKAEKAGTDRADRWGIFIGHWAPTFFGLGNALRSYEK